MSDVLEDEEKRDFWINRILEEEEHLDPRDSFLRGVSVDDIDLNKPEFDKPFLKYAHYNEAFDAILLVIDWIESRPDFENQFPEEIVKGTSQTVPIPACELWTFTEESKIKLQTSLKHSENKESKQLREELEKRFSPHIPLLNENWDPERMELKLGIFILENWKKEDFERWSLLVKFYLLQNRLEIMGAIRLFGFIALRSGIQEGTNELNHSYVFSILLNIGGYLISVLSGFGIINTAILIGFFTGLVEYIKNSTENASQEIKDYQAYQNNFTLYFESIREDLGADFQKYYDA